MKEEYSPDGEMKKLTGFYEKFNFREKKSNPVFQYQRSLPMEESNWFFGEDDNLKERGNSTHFPVQKTRLPIFILEG